MNNYKTVFFVAGVLLIVLGVFMFIPFFVQLIYDEQNSTFLSSSAITIFIGILLVLTNLEDSRKLNLQQAFLLTTLSWLSIAVFGCLPFLFENFLSFFNQFPSFYKWPGASSLNYRFINHDIEDLLNFISKI